MAELLDIQLVFYAIGVAEPIGPEEPLPPVPEIPRGAVVVLEGRAPIWRYGLAFHRLHGSAAGAIAVYDPRLGAVIVATHRPEFREGQVLEVTPPDMVGGVEQETAKAEMAKGQDGSRKAGNADLH